MAQQDELRRRVERIRSRMDAAGLKARQLSRMAGVGYNTGGNIVSGRTKNPGLKNIMKLEEALDRHLGTSGLLPEEPPLRHVNGHGEPTNVNQLPYRGLPMCGRVEAGSYRPRVEFDDARVYVDFPRDDKWPTARQWAFEVSGDSMDLAGIYPGGNVRVVSIEDTGRSIDPGDIIVVERATDGGQLVELSVKEVEIMSDGSYRLRPRSSNPTHEAFLLPRQADADDATTVRAIGHVTAYFKVF